MVLISGGLPVPGFAQQESLKRLIRDGDRVVFLGATFLERMQDANYLETELTSRIPQRGVTFRNLGWSGDTVGGIARAVFGTPEQGFVRLTKDLSGTRPTVVVLCYGGNEAHAGPAGLPEFESKTGKLLENLEKLTSRIVFLAPSSQEQRPAPLPSPATYNNHLKTYVQSLRRIAGERGHVFLGIDPIASLAREDLGLEKSTPALTENGLHYGDRGYWALAPGIAAALDGPLPAWSVTLDVKEQKKVVLGVTVTTKKLAPDHVAFSAVSSRLPRPRPPRIFDGPPIAAPQTRTLKVVGLQSGSYKLMIDGKVAQVTTAGKLASGLSLSGNWEQAQVAQLRKLIVAKNKLYFHRYRPQNETYLFLFRKREQGNNAVEIPQFDPLVEAAEKKIALLAQPKLHLFELVRQK